MVTIQTLTALYLGLYYTAVHLKLALVQPLHIRDLFHVEVENVKTVKSNLFIFLARTQTERRASITRNLFITTCRKTEK